jgi:hypothetical protein
MAAAFSAELRSEAAYLEGATLRSPDFPERSHGWAEAFADTFFLGKKNKVPVKRPFWLPLHG